MTRVKGGPRGHRQHKKIIAQAKGFRGTRNNLFKRAHQAVVRAAEHAFAGRKQKKRDMRSLWISRINGALTQYEIKYSRFINGLNKSKLDLNRKQLAEMAVNDKKGFETVVNSVKAQFSK